MSAGGRKRVLLIGCGQLGSRHLQAVAALPMVEEIEIVDPRPEALALGQARLAELPQRSDLRVRWHASLEAAQAGGALCIVATQAEGRCALVRDVMERLGYSAFLLEKIVGQSIAEIEALEGFLHARGCSAWVNFKTRAYPIHRYIKQRLDPDDPVIFSAMGGNHGLANNGVHTADLFVFYEGSADIELAGAAIDPVLHPSKRGGDVFDLSGTLQGTTAKGSHFTLSYARDHQQSEHLTISTRRYRCLVDHAHRWAVESDPATGGAWQPVPFEGDLLVSHMTREFAQDILTQGRCALPTLTEALIAHRFILGALQPGFSHLLQREVERCPVT